jgi:hypothetical protein
MPPPIVIGGKLTDANKAELVQFETVQVENGLYLNLHDVAAHLCNPIQPTNKRQAQDGPRDSKAFKAHQSDNVPVATNRGRSTSRNKENGPAQGTETLTANDDAAPTLPSADAESSQFTAADAAHQRKAAAEQSELLQQQMHEADRNMQIVNKDREAAQQQFP